MTAPELKPCPFCGGPARYQIDHTTECRDSIWCAKCDYGLFDPDEQGSVADVWNRRDDLPPTLEQAKALPEIKALVEALQFYADPTLTGYDVCVTDYGLGMERGHILQDDGDMARAALSDLAKMKGE